MYSNFNQDVFGQKLAAIFQLTTVLICTVYFSTKKNTAHPNLFSCLLIEHPGALCPDGFNWTLQIDNILSKDWIVYKISLLLILVFYLGETVFTMRMNNSYGIQHRVRIHAEKEVSYNHNGTLTAH